MVLPLIRNIMARLAIFLFFLVITTMAFSVGDFGALVIVFPVFLFLYVMAEDIDEERG